MAWRCRACDRQFDSARPGKNADDWRCPGCGAVAELESTEVRPPNEKSVETVFQPALMMDSILDELEEPGSKALEPSREPGTEALETEPSALPSPFLQLDLEAYILVLGAPPGDERRSLTRAKTSFGRRGADITLADAAMSSLHFQIEAFGNEFFVRDLDSRNGTYLNGSRVRYSQLLAGDQITAGKTSLIFRTSEDRIGRE